MNYKIAYGTAGQGNSYEISTNDLNYVKRFVTGQKSTHNAWTQVWSNLRQDYIYDDLYGAPDLLFTRDSDLRTKTGRAIA